MYDSLFEDHSHAQLLVLPHSGLIPFVTLLHIQIHISDPSRINKNGQKSPPEFNI